MAEKKNPGVELAQKMVRQDIHDRIDQTIIVTTTLLGTSLGGPVGGGFGFLLGTAASFLNPPPDKK